MVYARKFFKFVQSMFVLWNSNSSIKLKQFKKGKCDSNACIQSVISNPFNIIFHDRTLTISVLQMKSSYYILIVYNSLEFNPRHSIVKCIAFWWKITVNAIVISNVLRDPGQLKLNFDKVKLFCIIKNFSLFLISVLLPAECWTECNFTIWGIQLKWTW